MKVLRKSEFTSFVGESISDTKSMSKEMLAVYIDFLISYHCGYDAVDSQVLDKEYAQILDTLDDIYYDGLIKKADWRKYRITAREAHITVRGWAC